MTTGGSVTLGRSLGSSRPTMSSLMLKSRSVNALLYGGGDRNPTSLENGENNEAKSISK